MKIYMLTLLSLDDEVQTNLLTALRENPDNRPVLYKLLAYMLGLLILPVGMSTKLRYCQLLRLLLIPLV